MASSLSATAARRGCGPDALECLDRAYEVAMEPRASVLHDDHDPAFLHPGRVALILLNDAWGDLGATRTAADEPQGLVHAVELGMLLESRDAELRVPEERVRSTLQPRHADAWASAPVPGSADLVERMVTLPPDIGVVVLAERLDHLRHEHLRVPAVPWAELAEEVAGAWLPVAERLAPSLARRYGHWLRTFRRRL